MIDTGIVVGIKDNLAQVQVECLLEACEGCGARTLCLGKNQERGIISAQNSLGASPGDEVEVDIPEAKYNKFLILLFSSLLAASLLGLGAGYVLSLLLSLPSSAASLGGLLLALFVAGFLLYRYLKNRVALYPVITSIIKKGARRP